MCSVMISCLSDLPLVRHMIHMFECMKPYVVSLWDDDDSSRMGINLPNNVREQVSECMSDNWVCLHLYGFLTVDSGNDDDDYDMTTTAIHMSVHPYLLFPQLFIDLKSSHGYGQRFTIKLLKILSGLTNVRGMGKGLRRWNKNIIFISMRWRKINRCHIQIRTPFGIWSYTRHHDGHQNHTTTTFKLVCVLRSQVAATKTRWFRAVHHKIMTDKTTNIHYCVTSSCLMTTAVEFRFFVIGIVIPIPICVLILLFFAHWTFSFVLSTLYV